MSDYDLSELLQTLKDIYAHPEEKALDHYFDKIHLLAEARYMPAIDFFLGCLSDARDDWREFCLQVLIFHYDLTTRPDIIKAIERLSVADKSADVRATAATILGQYNKRSLEWFHERIEAEQDIEVKTSIMSAFLTQQNMPPYIQLIIIDEISKRDIFPDRSEIDTILSTL